MFSSTNKQIYVMKMANFWSSNWILLIGYFLSIVLSGLLVNLFPNIIISENYFDNDIISSVRIAHLIRYRNIYWDKRNIFQIFSR